MNDDTQSGNFNDNLETVELSDFQESDKLQTQNKKDVPTEFVENIFTETELDLPDVDIENEFESEQEESEPEQRQSKIHFNPEQSAKLYVSTFDSILSRLASLVGGKPFMEYKLSKEEKEEYTEITANYFEATGKTFSPAWMFYLSTGTITAGTLHASYKDGKKKLSEADERDLEAEIKALRMANEKLKNSYALLEEQTSQLEIPFPATPKATVRPMYLDNDSKINNPDELKIQKKRAVKDAKQYRETVDVPNTDNTTLHTSQPKKPTVWKPTLREGIDRPTDAELKRKNFRTDRNGYYTTTTEGKKLNPSLRTEKRSLWVQQLERQDGKSYADLIKSWLKDNINEI